MKRAKYKRYITAVVLFVILAIILTPLLWSISMSFDKTATTHLPEFSLIPHEPSTFNYKAAAKMIDLPQYFKKYGHRRGGEHLPRGHVFHDVRLCLRQAEIRGQEVLVHFHACGHDGSF